MWDNVFAFFFGFNNKIIIDLHVTGLATQLNLFDWLLNNAFQRELYVELRCYTLVIDWLTGKCTAVQRVSKVGFDWIFEIRVGKLMRITCVFNAFSTRTRQGQIDGR